MEETVILRESVDLEKLLILAASAELPSLESREQSDYHGKLIQMEEMVPPKRLGRDLLRVLDQVGRILLTMKENAGVLEIDPQLHCMDRRLRFRLCQVKGLYFLEGLEEQS